MQEKIFLTLRFDGQDQFCRRFFTYLYISIKFIYDSHGQMFLPFHPVRVPRGSTCEFAVQKKADVSVVGNWRGSCGKGVVAPFRNTPNTTARGRMECKCKGDEWNPLTIPSAFGHSPAPAVRVVQVTSLSLSLSLSLSIYPFICLSLVLSLSFPMHVTSASLPSFLPSFLPFSSDSACTCI